MKTFDQILKENFSDKLKDKIGLYTLAADNSGATSIKDRFSDEEYNDILSNMTEYNNPLYRVEGADYTLKRLNLKVGSTFSFKGDLRSFTRSKDSLQTLISDADEAEPVVFITVGKVKHIDINPYSYWLQETDEDQEESLIGGKWQVTEIKPGDRLYAIVKIKQI